MLMDVLEVRTPAWMYHVEADGSELVKGKAAASSRGQHGELHYRRLSRFPSLWRCRIFRFNPAGRFNPEHRVTPAESLRNTNAAAHAFGACAAVPG